MWATANAGAATAGAMGAKVSNKDLVPRFKGSETTNGAAVLAYLSGKRGVKVTSYGRR